LRSPLVSTCFPYTTLFRSEAVLRPRVVGSPRSPDGRLLVAPSPLGLYVSRSPKPELWSIGSTDWTTLSDCAVANDAAAIACVSRSEEHTSELQSRENLVCR